VQLESRGSNYEQSGNFADVQKRVIHKSILTTILTAIGWFLLPIAWYLVFTLALVLADLYTGWKASNMKFISRGIRRTIDKVVMYYIAILLAHAFDLIYLADGGLIVSFAVSSVIASTEILSVFENIQRHTGTGLLSAVKKYLNGNLKS
jgi:phage-related holin